MGCRRLSKSNVVNDLKRLCPIELKQFTCAQVVSFTIYVRLVCDINIGMIENPPHLFLAIDHSFSLQVM